LQTDKARGKKKEKKKKDPNELIAIDNKGHKISKCVYKAGKTFEEELLILSTWNTPLIH